MIWKPCTQNLVNVSECEFGCYQVKCKAFASQHQSSLWSTFNKRLHHNQLYRYAIKENRKIKWPQSARQTCNIFCSAQKTVVFGTLKLNWKNKYLSSLCRVMAAWHKLHWSQVVEVTASRTHNNREKKAES